VSISEPSTSAGGLRTREAQPVLPGTSTLSTTWGLATGPLGSDEILLEGGAKRLRAWAPPGVPLSGTADEHLRRWRVGTSPSGQALDPTAFPSVGSVAVGEVLGAVPKTLDSWVTATTVRALDRLEQFVRTGAPVADAAIRDAQAAAADLRRELSEARRARRAPTRVSRRGDRDGEDTRVARDALSSEQLARLIAALAAEVFEFSLIGQRWREEPERLHDPDVGCASMGRMALESLRELREESLCAATYESHLNGLHQHRRWVLADFGQFPTPVGLSQFTPSAEMLMRLTSASTALHDGHLWPDGSTAEDSLDAHESVGRMSLAVTGPATEHSCEREGTEHLLRRLVDEVAPEREPDLPIGDFAAHVHALRAVLGPGAAQSNEFLCGDREQRAHFGHLGVSMADYSAATDAAAQFVHAQLAHSNVLMLLGFYPSDESIIPLEFEPDAGKLPPTTSALSSALRRSLDCLRTLRGAGALSAVGAPPRSTPLRRSADPGTCRDSYPVRRLRVHAHKSCEACAERSMAETACCSGHVSSS
jgi:hypothetical protein